MPPDTPARVDVIYPLNLDEHFSEVILKDTSLQDGPQKWNPIIKYIWVVLHTINPFSETHNAYEYLKTSDQRDC